VALATSGIRAARVSHQHLPPQRGGMLSTHWSLSEAQEGLKTAMQALACACAHVATANGFATGEGYESPILWEVSSLESRSGDSDAYSTLKHALSVLDGRHTGYELQSAAVGALLVTDPTIELPRELLLCNHAGNASASASASFSFGAGGDCRAVLEKLVSAGRLADACALATSAMMGAATGPEAGVGPPPTAPYSLLDRLLLASRSAIAGFQPRGDADEKNVLRLQHEMQSLEAQIRSHFADGLAAPAPAASCTGGFGFSVQ